jgi:hypothetical protein
VSGRGSRSDRRRVGFSGAATPKARRVTQLAFSVNWRRQRLLEGSGEGRRRAGLEYSYSGWLHGLTMLAPRGSKYLVFRVAMVIAVLWAMAAMTASSSGARSGTG